MLILVGLPSTAIIINLVYKARVGACMACKLRAKLIFVVLLQKERPNQTIPAFGLVTSLTNSETPSRLDTKQRRFYCATPSLSPQLCLPTTVSPQLTPCHFTFSFVVPATVDYVYLLVSSGVYFTFGGCCSTIIHF